MIKIIHVGNLEEKMSKKKVQVFPTPHPGMILTGWDMLPTKEAASEMAYLASFSSRVTFFHKPSTCHSPVFEKLC